MQGMGGKSPLCSIQAMVSVVVECTIICLQCVEREVTFVRRYIRRPPLPRPHGGIDGYLSNTVGGRRRFSRMVNNETL